MTIFSRKNLHTFFEAGVFIKALDSIVEVTLGVLFFALSSQTVNRVIFFIFGDELTEQPRDAIWTFLLHGFTGISAGTQFFWAIVFLAHGTAKILLVLGLLSKKLWIYPAAAVTFGCFAVYQIYHMTNAPSLFLGILTAFDILFVALIIQEYKYQKIAFK